MSSRHTVSDKMRRGVLLSTPLDGGKVVERELIQCCHCQFTAAWQPGMERGWGLCWRCSDWHCAKPECRNGCRPWKQWIENMEAGKAPDAVPIVASVSHQPPNG